MKMKLLMATAIAFSVVFTSCKKDNSPANDSSTELSAHSEDQARITADDDAISNDANAVVDGYASFTGRPGTNGTTDNLLCNGTAVLDSSNGVRRLTVTYNGVNCAGNLNLNGVVVYSMPLASHWRDAGAVLTVDAQNLVVTRVGQTRSITINGTKTITNVTGGLLRDLATIGTITHDVASNGVSITFDNGTQRVWRIAKRREFTFSNGVNIRTTGTHTEGLIQNVSEWGTNRFGNPFITSITQPLIVRQDCNFRLVSGEVAHERMAADVVVTFGLDQNGNLTTCPAAGVPFYFKAVWTGLNNVTRTVILPY